MQWNGVKCHASLQRSRFSGTQCSLSAEAKGELDLRYAELNRLVYGLKDMKS